MDWCACAGTNERCDRCGGKGYLNPSDLEPRQMVAMVRSAAVARKLSGQGKRRRSRGSVVPDRRPRASVPPSRQKPNRKPERKPSDFQCHVCARQLGSRLALEQHSRAKHSSRSALVECGCGARVRPDNMARHERRCGGVHRTAPIERTTLTLPEPKARNRPLVASIAERLMDATFGVGGFARDGGRFGSPAVYDNFTDEGAP